MLPPSAVDIFIAFNPSLVYARLHQISWLSLGRRSAGFSFFSDVTAVFTDVDSVFTKGATAAAQMPPQTSKIKVSSWTLLGNPEAASPVCEDGSTLGLCTGHTKRPEGLVVQRVIWLLFRSGLF